MDSSRREEESSEYDDLDVPNIFNEGDDNEEEEEGEEFVFKVVAHEKITQRQLHQLRGAEEVISMKECSKLITICRFSNFTNPYSRRLEVINSYDTNTWESQEIKRSLMTDAPRTLFKWSEKIFIILTISNTTLEYTEYLFTPFAYVVEQGKKGEFREVETLTIRARRLCQRQTEHTALHASTAFHVRKLDQHQGVFVAMDYSCNPYSRDVPDEDKVTRFYHFLLYDLHTANSESEFIRIERPPYGLWRVRIECIIQSKSNESCYFISDPSERSYSLKMVDVVKKKTIKLFDKHILSINILSSFLEEEDTESERELLLATGDNKCLYMYDVETTDCLRRFCFPSQLGSFDILHKNSNSANPNGVLLLFAGSVTGHLTVYDVKSNFKRFAYQVSDYKYDGIKKLHCVAEIEEKDVCLALLLPGFYKLVTIQGALRDMVAVDLKERIQYLFREFEVVDDDSRTGRDLVLRFGNVRLKMPKYFFFSGF